ncbi:methyl-accepting chemotaxis protein [Pseudomonas sp. 21LCFQ02]|uniref:HAMP domain-containing methyl-accepting chemotaxis protein n=1 Tax=Pseudomonas sp. 21LCFQ02 TaxID=2957505 RepID=UPI00209B4463|nr:methyl-accepting chemotaxis protein [Pseudomonas sp. 21LCFQ02]MCO8167612.1 methyl-accepting chemotaxis protein [Pseudomonas sp. 21LCFQ02]
MFALINRTLDNLSVRVKLTLGFGLVLALTLAITLTGWHGLDNMIERSEAISSIGQLSNLTKDLRAERIIFREESTPQSAARVENRLNELESHLGVLRKEVESPQSLDLLTAQSRIIASLEKTFAELSLQRQMRDQTSQKLVQQSAQAVTAVGQVETEVLKSLSQEQDNAERLEEFTNLAQLKQQIQLARFQVQAYTFSAKQEDEHAAVMAIDEALKEVQEIAREQADDNLQALKPAAEALQQYKEQLGRFRDAQAGVEQSQEAMESLGDQMLESVAELISQQGAQRDDQASRSRTALTGVTVLAMGMGLLAAWVMTRQIIVPLRQTLAAAGRIAQGDLSRNLIVERNDELGQLQRSMQDMTENLRGLLSGIGDGVNQLSSAAEQLSAVTEQTSAGVNSQKTETDQVATAINQMAATVLEVASSAQQASNAAVQADQQARDGDRVVGEAIGQIEQLSQEMLNSTQAMNRLRQESDKIAGVLDVIKSVSQQTNLLALNAAIEAARAGEAGRGFAVVADEVRSLAQRTQQSTEEIEELIAALQSGTQQVVSTLDNSRSLTEQSVELSRRAGAALEQITRTVTGIQDMNRQIATASEQQSAVAEQINRSVVNVREISEQTATASEQTASSSIELARLGTRLKELVSRFKV